MPGEEFLHRERIAGAGLLKGQKPAADRGDNFRLAANDPASRARSRQIGDGQRTAVRPDDVFHPRAMGFGHWYSHTQTTLILAAE